MYGHNREATIMSEHKSAWAQMCLGTNVWGHKRVWSQTCVGTVMYVVTVVWAQSGMGTNVVEPFAASLFQNPFSL